MVRQQGPITDRCTSCTGQSQIVERPEHRLGSMYRVHKDWQLSFSGVYSIMMEKSAQPGGGGGEVTPPHYIYHHVQSFAVYASAKRASLYYFSSISTPINTLWYIVYARMTMLFKSFCLRKCLLSCAKIPVFAKVCVCAKLL
jgi:hypothetical protein